MAQIIWTGIICFVAGALLAWRFKVKASEFAHEEVVKITQKIEQIKEKDLRQYSILKAEWESFISNSKADVNKVSTGLADVIKMVREL